MIKPYIVDFDCHEIGLVIELDVGQHGTDYFQTEKNYGFMYEIDLCLKCIGLKYQLYFLIIILGKICL